MEKSVLVCLIVFLTFVQPFVAKQYESKIVVVGAGAAGLACATRLKQYGFNDLTVLEAEPRIGGRIHTIPFGDNVLEMGAQFCHGEEGNKVFEMVNGLNLLEYSTNEDTNTTFFRSDGTIMDYITTERFKHIFKSIYDESFSRVNKSSNESYFDYLLSSLNTKLELPGNRDLNKNLAMEILENYDREQSSNVGSESLKHVSAASQLDYKDCPGDQFLTWKSRGFHAFLDVLLNTSATGSEYGILDGHIKISEKVELISWQRSDGKVLVKTSKGAEILADHVIVTVSLGVLKKNHLKLFVPTLPEDNKNAIKGLGYDIINKIFLEFKDPFWPLNWGGASLLWRQEDLNELKKMNQTFLQDIYSFYRVKGQSRILSAWIIGPHAIHLEKLDDEEVKDMCVYLLRRFLPFNITEPIAYMKSDWGLNPNFFGSYSYHSLATRDLETGNRELSEPLYNEEIISGQTKKPLVQFAGEATHSHYYSTVYGAVETGYREADRLNNYSRSSVCSTLDLSSIAVFATATFYTLRTL